MPNAPTIHRIVSLAAAASLSLVPAALGATAPTAAQIKAGKTVFLRSGCAKCHVLKAVQAAGTVGPNLDTHHYTLAAIIKQVTQGGRFMPPFGASVGGSLSATQIKNVAAFVYANALARPIPTAAATVTVTAGKPSEFKFTLLPKTFRHGAVTFKVTNRGALPHNFKWCTAPRTNAANTCTGKATTLTSPGKSATLKVTITKAGTYEFLCTVPGHAAAGMKGLAKVT